MTSQENLETVRRLMQAYVAGDIDGVVRQLDPGIEWDISAHPLPDWPNTGSGLADFRRHVVGYARGWRHYRAELSELIEAGDEILAILRETVGLRDSDAVLDRDLPQVWTVRDGVVVRLRVFKTKAQALEAAGHEAAQ
jgi:ketosteroid isomerase-like protein